MPYEHNPDSIKVSLDQSKVDPEIMELIPELRVVWMDQQVFDPNQMELCGCPNYRCWQNGSTME